MARTDRKAYLADAPAREVTAADLTFVAGALAPEFRAAQQAREEAAILRARTVSAPESYPASPIEELRRNDQGPAVQRARGRLEVVDAVDPARPEGGAIRRARIRDPLRRMVVRKHLPYRCYVAADQFRADVEQADGGHDPDEVRLNLCGGSSAPWLRQNPGAPGQWAAIERVKAAWAEVGLIALGVFTWVVLSSGTLEDYDQCRGTRKGTSSATLRAALDRLADHYNLGDMQPPPGWA